MAGGIIRSVKNIAAALTACALFGVVTPLGAQTDAETRLAQAIGFKCAFALSVRTTWKEGAPVPLIRDTTKLSVEIRNVQADSGSAGLVTGRGVLDVTMVASERARFFIDAGGGKVTVTTVLGESTTGSRLRATHSIHDFVALEIASFRSEPEIVLHTGDCEPTLP